MDRDEIVRQARIDGMAKVDGEWRRIVAIDALDQKHPIRVADDDGGGTYTRWLRVADVTAIHCAEMPAPPDDGPALTVSDEVGDPSLFDLAEQVARWPNAEDAADVLCDFVRAAHQVLIERGRARDLLRDGGAR